MLSSNSRYANPFGLRNLLMAIMVTCLVYPPSAAGGRDDRFVNRLTARKESVRMTALAEAQATVQEKYYRLPLLIRAAEKLNQDLEPEKPLRVSHVKLIYLIGSIDRDQSRQALVDMLQCEHPEVITLAADTLGKNKFRDSIDDLAKLKDHDLFRDRYGFRFNLIRSLFLMDHPDAIDLITSWVDSLDGQIKREIEKHLENVNLDSFKGDEERFAAWQKQRELAFGKPSQQSESGSDEESMPDRDTVGLKSKLDLKPASFRSSSVPKLKLVNKSSFYGMDIYAKRMMFVIDHSGSMEEEKAGISKLKRAKIELIRAIEGLHPDAEFAIMFYETDIDMWRDELTKATDHEKQYAIRFVKGLGYGNRTNTHGALVRSLNFDSQLESVYILTDGKPTEGRLRKPNAIIDDVIRLNRFRHLHFNTIGIAVEGATERFLQDLAVETGGEFRKVD